MGKKFKKKMDKKVKKMDYHDVKLVKLSSIAFALLVLNLWPAAMAWVASVHWGWFLGVTILFVWRPARKFWA
ncbi:hypothetical protein GOV13_05220 [Candidatus Pacearchaeota archaeon]|nr:hypothetical protein [Candidatus Pacearchaeota archaeon]